jgi:hypothetical protein
VLAPNDAGAFFGLISSSFKAVEEIVEVPNRWKQIGIYVNLCKDRQPFQWVGTWYQHTAVLNMAEPDVLTFVHRYQQAELVHCRFAMLGAAGVLVPDLFKGIGLGGPAAQVPWFEAGAYPYFADPKTLFGIMMLLFAWVELRR